MNKKALSQILNKAQEVKGVQELSQEEARKVSGGYNPTVAGIVEGDFALEELSEPIRIKDLIISGFESGDWTGNAYRYSF